MGALIGTEFATGTLERYKTSFEYNAPLLNGNIQKWSTLLTGSILNL